jgi:hypothetical protein
VPAAGDVERYEQLRAVALDGALGPGLGLALLHRRGVSAWVRAWPAQAPTPAAAGVAGGAAVALAPGAQEIVGVLAAMALAVITTNRAGG